MPEGSLNSPLSLPELGADVPHSDRKVPSASKRRTRWLLASAT